MWWCACMEGIINLRGRKDTAFSLKKYARTWKQSLRIIHDSGLKMDPPMNTFKTNWPAAQLCFGQLWRPKPLKIFAMLTINHDCPKVYQQDVWFEDWSRDPEANRQTAELLCLEEPTMANVLVDYFHLHKFHKDVCIETFHLSTIYTTF